MTLTIIKICGITNLEDALFCCTAGADLLGFVFAESPRKVEPGEVKKIVEKLPAGILKTGVFVNQDADEVEKIAEECGLDVIQLHGDEPPESCGYFRKKGYRIIKAIRVKDEDSLREIQRYDKADFILLDGYKKRSYGGTGKTFDWKIAKEAHKFKKKLILSGGLNCDNVMDAINAVKPYGVDASSGLEISPGKKDHKLVERFIKIVKGVIARSGATKQSRF